ncbi:MAG: hypothetical protein WCY93_11080 [Anaerolineaceae bacterium]
MSSTKYQYLNPYYAVDEPKGSQALVFFDSSGSHYIDFIDNEGHFVYREEFDEGTPIQVVEQAANDWALGYRTIA